MKKYEENKNSYPKGLLVARKRKDNYSFFHRKKVKGVVRDVSITENRSLLNDLINKKADEKAFYIARKNIEIIKKFIELYKNNDYANIISSLSKPYKEAKRYLYNCESNQSACTNYKDHCNSDDDHKYRTSSGIWVRSKNEVFVCDRLEAYHIPYAYEEKLFICGYNYYPDFLIFLPDGRKIIWEHLGMLSEYDYFMKNAKKIYNYYMEGYYLGENLIITFNEKHDRFDLKQIDDIIIKQILPYFKVA